MTKAGSWTNQSGLFQDSVYFWIICFQMALNWPYYHLISSKATSLCSTFYSTLKFCCSAEARVVVPTSQKKTKKINWVPCTDLTDRFIFSLFLETKTYTCQIKAFQLLCPSPTHSHFFWDLLNYAPILQR
jgi:hypothetical protein